VFEGRSEKNQTHIIITLQCGIVVECAVARYHAHIAAHKSEMPQSRSIECHACVLLLASNGRKEERIAVLHGISLESGESGECGESKQNIVWQKEVLGKLTGNAHNEALWKMWHM